MPPPAGVKEEGSEHAGGSVVHKGLPIHVAVLERGVGGRGGGVGGGGRGKGLGVEDSGLGVRG